MIVLAMGTWDLLHYGHVDFLKVAATLGSELIVGVNTDEFAASYRPRPPVMNEDERAYALMQLGYKTVLNKSAGRELIEEIGPRIIAEGSDWIGRDWYAQTDTTQEWLDARRIILAYIPRQISPWPISASAIRDRIEQASARL